MKIGILGGGQLGKLLERESSEYPYDVYFMDKAGCPISTIYTRFVTGDIQDYQDVLEFGKDKDVISIEIEHVNLEALKELESMGKCVIPSPASLEIIQDKGKQKEFYLKHNIPSTKFILADTWEKGLGELTYPLFQKYRTGGYDGKGVVKVNTESELQDLEKVPSMFEEEANIESEISIIIAKSLEGEIYSFPIAKFVADPELNLVDYLIFPATFPHSIEKQAHRIALQVAQAMEGAGIFSVEMFVTHSGEVLVNETAPRVHNSGHSTIEASPCSQYGQWLRIMAGLPLERSKDHHLSAMYNLIGPSDFEGACKLEGLEKVLEMEKTYLHWYLKTESKAGRKMGHITFLADDEEALLEKINFAKANLKIVAQ